MSADNEEAYPQREFLEDMMTDLVEDIGVILERYRVEAAAIVGQLVAVEQMLAQRAPESRKSVDGSASKKVRRT